MVIYTRTQDIGKCVNNSMNFLFVICLLTVEVFLDHDLVMECVNMVSGPNGPN